MSERGVYKRLDRRPAVDPLTSELLAERPPMGARRWHRNGFWVTVAGTPANFPADEVLATKEGSGELLGVKVKSLSEAAEGDT
jgi:hypothetical protein